MTDDDAYEEDILLAMADQDGGRVDPARMERRWEDSPARLAFERLREKGCLDADGWITPIGRERLDDV